MSASATQGGHNKRCRFRSPMKVVEIHAQKHFVNDMSWTER